jgi:purine-binding chemotaxis protein CheW
MDILAARKKAAERARSRQKPGETRHTEPEPVEPQAGESAHISEDNDAGQDAAGSANTPPDAGPDPVESQNAEAAFEETTDEPIEIPAREIEMLSFRLGGEEYAVMVELVREVLKRRELTMVPNTPDYILGVISLRGIMLPVIDLCIRLGITPGVRDEKSRIIVASPGEEDVGLIVDRVTGVHRIKEDEIKPPPENIEHGGEFLRGIIRKDDKLYIVLDLAKVVNFYGA